MGIIIVLKFKFEPCEKYLQTLLNVFSHTLCLHFNRILFNLKNIFVKFYVNDSGYCNWDLKGDHQHDQCMMEAFS